MSIRKKQVVEIVVAVVVAVTILGGGFWFGWVAGRNYPENITVTDAANIMTPGTATSTIADFSVFWQAWNDIDQLYLWNSSTTAQQKMYGAINGLAASLNDPYTEFFSPADGTQFQQDITGDFGGVGADLDVNTQGKIVVVAPLKGSPAAEAGLKAGDEIVAINGSSTDTMTIDGAVNLIRGAVGTKVTLSIFRAGWSAPKDFAITREDIQIPLVDFEMKGTIAHITLDEFDEDAGPLFAQALTQAEQAKAKGIVLDLRGDPGGYLEVAVDLAGYFLKPGSLVVKEVGRSVPEQDFTTSGSGAFANMPMAILVDGGSASASEILAGALHDDRKIPLVGTQTFGKGVVQQIESLSDGSTIKITVADWITPSGATIEHIGLTPQYVVPLTASDTAAGQDPQLAKALEVVQGEIAANGK